jgi:hypothetical protein
MATRINAALFDRYIPIQLKNRNDFHVIAKAKILMGLYLATLTMICFMFLFLILLIHPSNPNWLHAISATFVALVFLSLEVLIFYKSENIATSGLIFSMMFFTLTFTTVVITGGWQSPIMLLFFCSPVISFLVGGRSEGLYIATLVFICGTLLMVAEQMDFSLFQILTADNIEKIRFGIWMTSISIIVSCLTTYDFLLEEVARSKPGVRS